MTKALIDRLNEQSVLIDKQKYLGVLKKQKRADDNLKKFRDVIYGYETTGG